MIAPRQTNTYCATDSSGAVYTTSSSRPLGFCIVFTGGAGVTLWSNDHANAEKAAARKRRLAKVQGIALTGCTVEILSTVETARTRTEPMTDSQRQERYRNRKAARAVAHRAALEAIMRAETIGLAQAIARKALTNIGATP